MRTSAVATGDGVYYYLLSVGRMGYLANYFAWVIFIFFSYF